MEKLAAIVGPTAAGKTEIAIQVAESLNGQIISCDSMQLYKRMDIGTAKADSAQRARVVHHLIDILDIEQEYSVAQYKNMAGEIISALNIKNILPILVGGTGLYYQAVVDDYQFYPLKKKAAVREKWHKLIKENGLPYAYECLSRLDPVYSSIISPADQKRIVRALEVYELTGKPFSSFQTRNRNKYNLAAVGLYMEKELLYERINKRVDEMVENGLVDEVKALYEEGGYLHLNSMQGLGYKEIIYYLQGFITFDRAIEEIKRETRRYAKRQHTWFKKDPRIRWFKMEIDTDIDDVVKKICNSIEGRINQ